MFFQSPYSLTMKFECFKNGILNVKNIQCVSGVVRACGFSLALVTFSILWLPAALADVSEPVIDLNDAIVLSVRDAHGPESKAVQMLVEEVVKRTRLRWARETSWPSKD